MIAVLLAVLSLDLSRFASPSYHAIERLADLPAPLAAAVAKLVDQPIAERGASWNATDVVDPGDPVPVRRFMLAAVSKTRLVVVYEHGGIARHQHVLVFDNPEAPKLRGSAFIGAPANVEELKKMLSRPLTAADHY
jgi:hypothetical protein